MLNACEPCVYVHNAPPYAPLTHVWVPRRTFRLRLCAYTRLRLGETRRGRVCAVADACYGRGWCTSIPSSRRHNDETNVAIILYRGGRSRTYLERWRCVYARWTWTDDHSRVPMQPPASALTTWHLRGVEFRCTCHYYVIPRQCHVGYVHHVMFDTETISVRFFGCLTRGGKAKNCGTQKNTAERCLHEYFVQNLVVQKFSRSSLFPNCYSNYDFSYVKHLKNSIEILIYLIIYTNIV
jgi:hypothetical protein